MFLVQHPLGGQELHGLVVEFHGFDAEVAPLQQGPSERACSRTDFKDVGAPIVFGDAFCDSARGVVVAQEVLPEVFFGANVHVKRG